MKTNPATAALGRAIFNLESEAGKMHIEASLARSNGDVEHARFFSSRESQAREDAKLLSELMEFLHNVKAVAPPTQTSTKTNND